MLWFLISIIIVLYLLVGVIFATFYDSFPLNAIYVNPIRTICIVIFWFPIAICNCFCRICHICFSQKRQL